MAAQISQFGSRIQRKMIKPFSEQIGGDLKPPVSAAPDQGVCGVDM
jgi:hypothetical protein